MCSTLLLVFFLSGLGLGCGRAVVLVVGVGGVGAGLGGVEVGKQLLLVVVLCLRR